MSYRHRHRRLGLSGLGTLALALFTACTGQGDLTAPTAKAQANVNRQAGTYTLVNVPPPAGCKWASTVSGAASSINSGGSVVGWGLSSCDPFSQVESFIWLGGTTSSLILPQASGWGAMAMGISDDYKVAGRDSRGLNLVYWATPSSTPVTPRLPPNQDFFAFGGIDNQGNVAVTLFDEISGFQQAYTWSLARGFRKLPDYGQGSVAYGMNISGIIVGGAGFNGSTGSVYWDTNGNLHNMIGIAGAGWTEAIGIAQNGQTAQWSSPGACLPRLGCGGIHVNIGSYNSYFFKPLVDFVTYPRAINGFGQVVGTRVDASGSIRGAVIDPKYGGTVLPLVGSVSEAFGVNDCGTITGYTQFPNQVTQAVIWTRACN
jgi:hypothetical protein